MILTIFAKSHFEWFVLHPNSFIHRLDSQFIHSVPSLCHCIPLRPIWENIILMCCSRVREKNMQSFEFIIILLNFTFYHLICAVVAVVIFMPVVPLAALICRRLLHPTNGLFCVYFRFSFLFFLLLLTSTLCTRRLSVPVQELHCSPTSVVTSSNGRCCAINSCIRVQCAWWGNKPLRRAIYRVQKTSNKVFRSSLQ